MSLDPMLYQQYQADPEGFMQNLWSLMSAGQQDQFMKNLRRQVEVRNSEGVFGDARNTGGKGGEAKLIGPVDEKGGAPDLKTRAANVVKSAVKQRDERQGLIDKARGGDPNGTFAPFEISPPTIPAQTTEGDPIVPTAEQTPTVTVTPQAPQLPEQDRTIAGCGTVVPNPTGPAIAIREQAPTGAAPNQGGVQQGFTDANAVLANTPIDKSGRTQTVSLSDWAVKNGFRLAEYAEGGMISEPVVGQGQWSGALYSIAEKGKERITPEGPHKVQIKLRSGHTLTVGGSD